MDIDFLSKSWKDEVIGAKLDNRLARKMQNARFRELAGTTTRESLIVSVLNKDKTIREIGFNKPGDLMLDNFGLMCAALFIGWTTFSGYSANYAAMKTTAGTVVNWRCYGSYDSYYDIQGTVLKLGQGTDYPARSDYNVFTPLDQAPENGWINNTWGTWANHTLSFMGSTSCNGSGTVREAGMFLYSVAGNYYMLFHDIVVPTLPYVSGSTLSAVYGVRM